MSTDQFESTSNQERMPISLSYLEFYSGIGGWSFALHAAFENVQKWFEEKDEQQNQTSPNRIKFRAQCLGAYDHSDLCYKVFRHNFPDIAGSSSESSNNDNAISGNDGDRNGNGTSLNCDNSKRHKKKKQKRQPSSSTMKRPISIEKLTKKQLEKIKADIWMMSPPCQPHTRQHNNQKEDVDDPRSKSFLHLCDLISTMSLESLPKIILLENVIGFERSNSCKYWRRALFSRQYTVLHFHLNPTQVGLPNDRPRYYILSILGKNENNHNLGEKQDSSYLSNCTKVDNQNNLDNNPPIQTSIEYLNVKNESDAQNVKNEHLMSISSFLDPIKGYEDKDKIQRAKVEDEFIFVSEKLLKSNASWCFDIVLPSDKRSACFTSSYGKYIRGTGSVLYVGDVVDIKGTKNNNTSQKESISETVGKFQLVSPEEREFDKNWNGMNLNHKLRYFTRTEIARLMGFPVKGSINENVNLDDNDRDKRVGSMFSFPSDCTEKQCWKLLGNSLNVKVAGVIAELALRIYLQSHHNM